MEYLTEETLHESRIRFSGAPWFDLASNRTINIYGSGGIGSHASLGISKMFQSSTFRIFDFDSVSLSNLGGQLFSPDQLGMRKVDAVRDNLQGFSLDNTNAYVTYGEDNFNPSDITLTALDSMRARKSIFENVRKKNRGTKHLFIDARMSADTIQIIAFRFDEAAKIRKYKKEYLFDDSEATNVVCSYKQTFFMGQMLSGYICAIIANYLTHLSEDVFPQEVPFFTEFSSPLMTYTSVKI